jgi:putative transposase
MNIQAEAVTVKRSNQLHLVPGVEEEDALWSIGDACAALYNELNYRRRSMWFTHQARKENMKAWQGDDLAAKYAPFTEASTAQQVQRRLNADWHTFLRLLKAKAEGKLRPNVKPRPPGYKKLPDGQREPFIIVRNDR